jgi:hypothetical protein
MVINNNLPAQTTASDLLLSQANLGQSLARLSSGSQIVTPADDAAALNVNVDSEHEVFTMIGVDLTAAFYATTLAADITTRAACRNPLTDLSARHSTHRSKPRPPNPDYYDSGIPHPHRERD